MRSSPDTIHTPVQVLPSPPQNSLQQPMENAEVAEPSIVVHDYSGLSPTDILSPAFVHSITTCEGQDRQSRMTSPQTPFSPKIDVTSPRSHLLSVPLAARCGKSEGPESSAQTSSNYGRDPCVSTSSHSSLVRDNHGDYEDNLNPEPGREHEFEVQNNKFAFSPGHLNKPLNPRNFGAFGALGGLCGLEKGLWTDLRSGLSMDETELDGLVSFDEVSRTFVSLPKSASALVPPSAIACPSAIATDESSMKQSQGRFSDRRRVFEINKLPERSSCGLRTMTRC